MTPRDETLAALGGARIISILRGDFGDGAEDLGEALVEGGLTVMEVSLTSADALALVRRLALRLGTRAVIGVGTVRRVVDCHQAAAAGARFAISPHTRIELIAAAHAAGLIAIPGALSPTEVVTALDAGADAVKLFPADWVGPAGFSSLLAPLPGVRFVPTGGVTVEKAREYLGRGAWAVGVGSPLVGAGLAAAGGLAGLAQRARAFAQMAAEAPPFSAS
ncbi:MAG TPA: bifunctional 4-hydroxy-2-oxoglutarate aldolase/2-dehydro-3-deoxy-phosphogluconate aldolase [Vicinamibacteria bacterium]|nr:bifunctional 4-hydroxy-2-oxoglutarate aldolase/2-dehydro-3-deoxy-phosphogluconate aldolase [Vicinamibacteria bacterium]